MRQASRGIVRNSIVMGHTYMYTRFTQSCTYTRVPFSSRSSTCETENIHSKKQRTSKISESVSSAFNTFAAAICLGSCYILLKLYHTFYILFDAMNFLCDGYSCKLTFPSRFTKTETLRNMFIGSQKERWV